MWFLCYNRNATVKYVLQFKKQRYIYIGRLIECRIGTVRKPVCSISVACKAYLTVAPSGANFIVTVRMLIN